MNAAAPTTARPPGGSGPYDAVVLAGGSARRLGGASKADLRLHGRRLLDHVLTAAGQAHRTVVVAPGDVAVPPGVLRTVEDPPYGGPVAGLAAGLDALGDGPPAPVVLVVSCDAPGIGPAVPRLLAALGADDDGAVLEDHAGRPQWLVGAYRTAVLRRRLTGLTAEAGTVHGAPVRALVAPLRLTTVRARGREADDVDTWGDLDRLGRT